MDVRPTRRSTQPSLSNGFTLLEMILSLSLMMLLMVGLTVGISLYAQFQGRSITGIHHAKVLRGSVDDLRDDLKACRIAKADPNAELSNQESSTTGTTPQSLLEQETTLQENVLDFESGSDEKPIHFVGRPNALLMLRGGHNLRFPFLNGNRGPSEHQVIWLAPSVQSLRLPVSRKGERVTYHDFRPLSDFTGAQRYTKLSTLPTSFESVPTSNSQSIDQRNWNTNDNVHSLMFRYLDSEGWVPQWDSHLRSEQLPLAVEITLSLTSNPSKDYRFVIRLQGSSA